MWGERQFRHEHRPRGVDSTWLDSILRDVGYALRRFRRQPGLAAAIVLTIGVAVGLTTSVYSIATGVLLRPLPFDAPDSLVQIWRTDPDWPRMSVSVPEYLEWSRDCRSFEALAAARPPVPFRLMKAGGAELAEGMMVSPNLFGLLGVRPFLGRGFLDREDQPGSNQVVILDEGFWRRSFGADPNIIGRRVRLVGRPGSPETFEVIGVLSSSVRLRYRTPSRCDLYVPLAFEQLDSSRFAAALWVFGRLRPGVSVSQASAEVRSVFERRSRSFIEADHGAGVRVSDLQAELVGHTRPTFVLIGTSVLVVLLIACVNVANLLLASGLQRAEELSTRLALGCSRRRLVQQLLVEHSLLSVAGGVIGSLFAVWSVPVVVRLAPASLPRLEQIRVGGLEVTVALSVAVLSGMVSGGITALLLVRRLLVRAGGTMPSAASMTHRLRSALVVVQMAMVVVLVAASGLLANSLWRLSHVDLGFDATHVAAVRLVMPYGYDTSRLAAFEGEILARISAHPGVVSAGAASELPFTDTGLFNYLLEDRSRHQAVFAGVSADFLRVLRIPLRSGRMLSASDVQHPYVAVVNERLAKEVFPAGNAIGQHIGAGDHWVEIVGVVGDVTEIGAIRNGLRERGLNRATLPRAYLPTPGLGDMRRILVVRTSGDPEDLTRVILTDVAHLEPEAAVAESTTLEAMVADAGADTRFYVAMLSGFAAVAFAVAGIGLFGVMRLNVARRTREFGVRMALGASASRVRRLVLRQAFGLTVLGAGIGLAVAVSCGQAMAVFLFEVSPTDPWTLTAVVLVLAGGAIAAAYLPARSASKVDPMTALRCE